MRQRLAVVAGFLFCLVVGMLITRPTERTANRVNPKSINRSNPVLDSRLPPPISSPISLEKQSARMPSAGEAPSELKSSSIPELNKGKKRSSPPLKRELKAFVSKRKIKVGDKLLSPIRGALAFLEKKLPMGTPVIARANGYALVESGHQDDSNGQLALYDAEKDNLVILTGLIIVKMDPQASINHLENDSGFPIAHSFPKIDTYFLKPPDATLEQLNRYVASTLQLPGVVEAKLDLIERRAVPQ